MTGSNLPLDAGADSDKTLAHPSRQREIKHTALPHPARQPNLLRKADYHILARLVPKEMLAGEVEKKLDAIVSVAESAAPRREEE